MTSPIIRRFFVPVAVFLAVWLIIRYLFPIALPFLAGAALSLAAEPLVKFFYRRCHLRRAFAAGIGVSIALVVAILFLLTLAAFVLRELGALAGIVPNLEGTALQGLSLLQQWLLDMAGSAPAGIRPLLSRSVENLFSGSTALVDGVTTKLLGLASGILSKLPDSALGLGTGIIAAYMISAKLPDIKVWFLPRVPAVWYDRYLPALRGLKDALWGWLRAQLKLTGITFLILTAGFIALQVTYAPLWAVAIALVDAIPILGTGVVLVPWSIVCLLQGQTIRAMGLLGIFAATLLTRSVLEPRLVGKQLGLDPLVTLVALYAGYKFWGILGMLLAPMLAVTAMKFAEMKL